MFELFKIETLTYIKEIFIPNQYVHLNIEAINRPEMILELWSKRNAAVLINWHKYEMERGENGIAYVFYV